MHLLDMKHPTPEKLQRMRESVAHIDLDPTSELSREHLDSIHPLIRDRLPPKPTGFDLSKQLGNIEGAQRLVEMGIKGMRFMPAVVNAKPVFEFPEMPLRLLTVKYKHPELKNGHTMQTTAYVTRVSPKEYLIEAYGMQGSAPRKSMPSGLRRFYDYGAPILGLSLATEALRMGGAERVYVPGMEYAEHRKAYKRPWVRQTLHETLRDKDNRLSKKDVANVKKVLRNWDNLSEGDVHTALSKSWELSTLGFPPSLMDRYYGDIRSRFKTQETILGHMETKKEFPFYSMDYEQLKPLRTFINRRTKFTKV